MLNRLLNRRAFLGTCAGVAAAFAAPAPNIVIIVSDDHGYGDVSAYENHAPEVSTPNIDRIAKHGVRFTQGYASAYVCAPTRAGLMTGRYQQRYGFYTASDSRVGLPLTEVTIADVLKKRGYRTAVFGKWHLGLEPAYHPLRRGFDEFYGFLGHGAHDYFELKADGGHNAIYRNDKTVDDTGYLTDNLAREATAFIERNRTKPFFLYLPFNAVHQPLQAPPQDVEKFHEPKKDRNTYLAMLHRMDIAVGRVLDTLEQHRLSSNTLLFFFSDNGGAKANSAFNGILRDYKHSVYEGGLRVPFMTSWPAKFPQAEVSREPVICLDIFPTVCEAVGVKLPTGRLYDGKSLIPLLTGKRKGPLHEALYWDGHEGKRAIRCGEWKLVENSGKFQLFHLEQDVRERNDLAAAQPAKVKELQQKLLAWGKELKPRIGKGGGE